METGVIEMFSSVQGEGKFVGYRQVFVRFEGCNLHCSYCDTENSIGSHLMCQIENHPGSRRFLEIINPVEATELAAYINNFLQALPHHSISFTGGEPLLQAEYLAELIPLIRGEEKIFLETNGTLVENLQRIIDLVDIISMDIKLPEGVGMPLWDRHQEFLHIAKEKDVYVKLVISGATQMESIERAIELIAQEGRDIPLFLQPVTPLNGVPGVSPDKMLELQALALEKLDDVRIIPQTHRMMDQL